MPGIIKLYALLSGAKTSQTACAIILGYQWTEMFCVNTFPPLFSYRFVSVSTFLLVSVNTGGDSLVPITPFLQGSLNQ